jgi:dihydrofolate reductase
MRKLKLQMQVSVDCFVAGDGGAMDWMVWDWDDELKKYVWNLTEPVDLILLGRNLAGGFIDAWTSRAADAATADDFARKMVETRKIVFSKSLEKVEWASTELCGGDLPEEVSKLKQSAGGDMIVYGGAKFAGSLIKNNLIDEFHLFVNPVAIGRGLSIFGDLDKYLNLKLIDSKTFSCGIVDLCYAPR